MSDEVEVLHRTLGFSVGAKRRGAGHHRRPLSGPVKALFRRLPLLGRQNPASLTDTLPQVPGTSRSQPEQAELFTEAGKR